MSNVVSTTTHTAVTANHCQQPAGDIESLCLATTEMAAPLNGGTHKAVARFVYLQAESNPHFNLCFNKGSNSN